MALSLGPQQVKQVTHRPLLVPSKPHQSYSTPRHFTTVVHDRLLDNEVLSISSTESPFKSPSSQVLPDLPSWTPLKTVDEDEGSDSELDQLPAKQLGPTDSPMDRIRKSPELATQNTVTDAQPTARLSSGAKPFKKARFAGVLITKKTPSYPKHSSLPKPPSSTTWGTSLVDALTRTFDANRYTAELSTGPSRSKEVASKVLQTEVETSDPEEDLIDPNLRLAHRPLKRPYSQVNDSASANISGTHSEDLTPLQQDIPQNDRLIKRLKAIPYEPNAEFIDSALGTVEAPISWDHELDFMTRDDDDVISPVQPAPPASSEGPMPIDEGNHTAGPARKAYLPTSHAQEPPKLGKSPRAVFSPYLSRGAQFRQRLDAFFGGDATVRTDRNARPRRVEFDFFAFDEPDREQSPAPSESSVSVSPGSTGEEAGAAPSTHVTSESPDAPSVGDVRVDQLARSQLKDGPATKQVPVGEEQMAAWIAALQRLVKGKVHVGEEDLETLSVILAEIESLKDSLSNVYLISELRESIKQLSELREIPFGDRNMLRQRAENIFQTWPSLMEADAS